MGFDQWVRETINVQAVSNGNAVSLDDFSVDGMKEFLYPKEFVVNGDPYSWHISSHHTAKRHLTTHYELWFCGKAFYGSMRIATGELTKGKVRKGLRMIYNYYL